jgi:nucleotide-binding universal stress UspA family protein
MERGLVVVRDSDRTEELLREAGEYADGVDAQLVLLSFISEEDYERDIKTLESIGDVENVTYSEQAALDGIEQELEEAASEAFVGFSVEYETVVTTTEGDKYAEATLDTASKHDCDHIFVVGRKRTPTGKAIFGDQVQRVILNFDGYVTVTTE